MKKQQQQKPMCPSALVFSLSVYSCSEQWEVKRVHISTISRAPDQRKHTRTRGYCASARTLRGRHIRSAHQRLCTRMQKHKNCPSVSHCTTPLNPATLTFSLCVCACFMSGEHYMHIAKLQKTQKIQRLFLQLPWDSCIECVLTLPLIQIEQLSQWAVSNQNRPTDVFVWNIFYSVHVRVNIAAVFALLHLLLGFYLPFPNTFNRLLTKWMH